jgi:hypothetical protein
VEAVGPAYIGVSVSLTFQGGGSRSCIRGKHGQPSSSMSWQAGLIN